MHEISNLRYVPILHTRGETENILGSLKKDDAGEPGPGALDEKINSINEMWDGISRKIDETNISCPSVRIYQDALPVCGIEAEIVEKLAVKGSRNHQLILELMKKGAKLEGTEDPNLLISEYDYLNNLLGAVSGSAIRR
jgi:hypothetical protein